MIRDLDLPVFGEIEKVLVCITAQSNSKRLINTAADIADKFNAQLHILHVNKGDSIFVSENTPELLDTLFNYGKQKGGMVHMFCDNDIPLSISHFIKNEGITKLVLGEAVLPEGVSINSFETHLEAILQSIGTKVELIMVKRDDEAVVPA